jgi:hypothetical protein
MPRALLDRLDNFVAVLLLEQIEAAEHIAI